MSHEALRKKVQDYLDGSWVQVRLSHLVALIEERDRLAATVSSWEAFVDVMETHVAQAEVECGGSASDAAPAETSSPKGQDGLEHGLPPPSPALDPVPEFEVSLGDRLPNGQECHESAPEPVVEKSRKHGGHLPYSKSGVVPWRASYTPNQCQLALRLLADGKAPVTVAAECNLDVRTVCDIRNAYGDGLERMMACGGEYRENELGEMYARMLERWKAAGNDPAIQPEPVMAKRSPHQANADMAVKS